MAHDTSDWLLLGGLAVANLAGALALFGVNISALSGLGGIAALGVSAGALWKLFG